MKSILTPVTIVNYAIVVIFYAARFVTASYVPIGLITSYNRIDFYNLGHMTPLTLHKMLRFLVLTLVAITAAHSAMILVNSAVSSAPFWLCSAIFSANFRGFAVATVGVDVDIMEAAIEPSRISEQGVANERMSHENVQTQISEKNNFEFGTRNAANETTSPRSTLPTVETDCQAEVMNPGRRRRRRHHNTCEPTTLVFVSKRV